MIRPVLIPAALAILPLLGAPARALDVPGAATLTFSEEQPASDYTLPVGPYFEGHVDSVLTKGAVTRQSWRISGFSQTSLQLLSQMSEQLQAENYDILFECQTDACGGFDFRFGTQVISEPHMHVDLGDFRYLAAHQPGAGQGNYVSLLVSRSPGAGYVQIVQTGAGQQKALPVAPAELPRADAGPANDAADSAIGAGLERAGYVVMSDLVFKTGSSNLEGGAFQSLADLALYLAGSPDKTVTLVGHTDAVGALDNNIALSRKRAQSVRRRLIESHGVPARQVAANGVGYLSPLASNQTEEGRAKNRRVEVVLTTTR